MCRDQELAPAFAVEVLVEDQPHKLRMKRGFYLINRKEAVTFFRVIDGGFDTVQTVGTIALQLMRKRVYFRSILILYRMLKVDIMPI